MGRKCVGWRVKIPRSQRRDEETYLLQKSKRRYQITNRKDATVYDSRDLAIEALYKSGFAQDGGYLARVLKKHPDPPHEAWINFYPGSSMESEGKDPFSGGTWATREEAEEDGSRWGAISYRYVLVKEPRKCS